MGAGPRTACTCLNWSVTQKKVIDGGCNIGIVSEVKKVCHDTPTYEFIVFNLSCINGSIMASWLHDEVTDGVFWFAF